MATRRRKTTARKKTAAKKTAVRRPAPRPVEPGDGQTLWVLDVPYSQRQDAAAAGARWDPARRAHIYVGATLPDQLGRWTPEPWSWEHWQHCASVGRWPDWPDDGTFTLRDHQIDAVAHIVAAQRLGRAGFLLADDLGLGKTLSAIAAVAAMPATMVNVLVVAPLSVLPAWRDTLARFGTHGRRWCLTNPDRLRKLVDVPASASAAKRTSTRNRRVAKDGRTLVSWDVVVFDESHLLKNPTAQRTTLSRTVSAGAFTIWMSATAGQHPLELSYLAPVLGQVTGEPVADLAAFEGWCARQGIQVTRGAYGRWEWEPNPHDLVRMRRILFDPPAHGNVGVGLRRVPSDIAGWPAQQRILRPVGLDPEARVLYDREWTEFRRQLRLAQRGGDPTSGMVAQTRFRQKASLLRVEGVADLVEELLGNGRQVFVSVQWLETLEALEVTLAGRGVPAVVMHGQQPPRVREESRRAFQAGTVTVLIATVVEGVNLQQGEAGFGNDTPRALVVADPRYSGIESRQIEGRTHRDGQHSPAFYVYAEGTVEEKVTHRALSRVADIAELHGDRDSDHIRELESVLAAAALAD